MPIRGQWTRFSEQALNGVPKEPGLYELGDESGQVVYIGCGDRNEDIRGRLRFHYKYHIRDASFFRYRVTTPFESTPELVDQECDAYVRAHGELPRLQENLPMGHLPDVS